MVAGGLWVEGCIRDEPAEEIRGCKIIKGWWLMACAKAESSPAVIRQSFLPATWIERFCGTSSYSLVGDPWFTRAREGQPREQVGKGRRRRGSKMVLEK